MHLHIDLSDGRLLLAVLILVSLLALVLVLTVHMSKSDASQLRQYYSQDFDRGSFLDFGLLVGTLLLPLIIYLIWG